jgi:hypothetical protein
MGIQIIKMFLTFRGIPYITDNEWFRSEIDTSSSEKYKIQNISYIAGKLLITVKIPEPISSYNIETTSSKTTIISPLQITLPPLSFEPFEVKIEPVVGGETMTNFHLELIQQVADAYTAYNMMLDQNQFVLSKQYCSQFSQSIYDDGDKASTLLISITTAVTPMDASLPLQPVSIVNFENNNVTFTRKDNLRRVLDYDSFKIVYTRADGSIKEYIVQVAKLMDGYIII